MKYDSRKNLSENKSYLLSEDQPNITNSYDINNEPISFKGYVVSTIKNSLTFQYPPSSKGSIHLFYLSGLNDLNMDESKKTQYFSPLPGMENKIFDVSYTNGRKNWEIYVKDWVSEVQKDILSWINPNAPYIIKSDGKDYYLNLQCLHSTNSDRWSGNMFSGACTKRSDLRGGGYFSDDGDQLHVIKKHHKPEEKKLYQDFEEVEITSNKLGFNKEKKENEEKKEIFKPKINLRFKIGNKGDVIGVN